MAILSRIAAIGAAVLLSGCIYAASSVITDDKSLKPFGESGRYEMKDFAAGADKPRVEGGTFAWTGSGYRLSPPTASNAKTVKLAVLNADWYVAEEKDLQHGPSYALAKVEGKVVRVFNSDCSKLSAADVAALGLTHEKDNPGCKASSWDQVAAALTKIAGMTPALLRTYTVE